jgi:hypothetical protein
MLIHCAYPIAHPVNDDSDQLIVQFESRRRVRSMDSDPDLWDHRAMPKDRSKTYSDRQSDASRAKKVKPATKQATKQPPKKKVPREEAGQAADRERSRSL